MEPKRYARPGKPTKYTELALNDAYEYLNSCTEEPEGHEEIIENEDGTKTYIRRPVKINMPNAGGLAIHLEVAKTTLYDWAAKHDDFAYFMELMNAVREDRLHEGGLSSRYASNLTAIMLGKYGYHKIVESNINNPDGSLRPASNLTTEQLQALADAEIDKKQS